MKGIPTTPSVRPGASPLNQPITPPVHRERLFNAASGKKPPLAENPKWALPFGAHVSEDGVSYRVWCPNCANLTIEIRSILGGERSLTTRRDKEGYQHAEDPQGQAGDCYRFRLGNGEAHADPVSRAQEHGVTGYSIVVDPATYVWNDQDWVRPPFRDLVIYELHIGTFTRSGTFREAIEKLPALKEIGINAVEVMPIGDFPGTRNWGYDGVLIYAPARAYGGPDDVRAFVDAAHGLGIAVIQDVVYNHMGPDGSSLAALAPQYFDKARSTPWGDAFNFDGPNSKPVRDFFAWNPVYWMHEFHMDGVRLDATHAITDTSPRHILAEISEHVHARGGYVIAEDDRNEVRLVEPRSGGGYGFDAVWADDFHHSVRVGQTGEQHAYLQNFSGTLEETVDTLQCGWRFRGQRLTKEGGLRGTECSHVPPSKLIHCITNHDQVGNHAFGKRLTSSIGPASYRAISMLLCLSPYTPLLFMGQEWAASTPFLFFTDHNPELGKLITEGRRKEFAAFPEFANNSELEVPDPQLQETFLQSKLNWDEISKPTHAAIRELYAACLNLRHSAAAFRPSNRRSWNVTQLQAGVGCIRFDDPVMPYLLIFHLWPNDELTELSLEGLPFGPPGLKPELLLSSNEARFGGTGIVPLPEGPAYVFGDAETLLFRGVA